MFISNAEKNTLINKINRCTDLLATALVDITVLQAKLKVLEAKNPIKPKPKKKLTAAQKAKQREYQKAYNERKKAEKLLTKESNVSS